MKRIEMHDLQELVRLHRMKTGYRDVARLVGISPNTERMYRLALQEAGLLDGPVDGLPELAVLRAAVEAAKPAKPAPKQQQSSVLEWMTAVKAMLRDGGEATAIYDRLRLEEPSFEGILSSIALVGELFKLERKFAALTPKKRKQERQKHSRPVVDAFFDWCDGLVGVALDDTPLAKAIGYARNQREALHTFLHDGRIPIHNNGSERELRREAVGRKNWLFIGNDEAGEVNATFVSLIASCEMHGIEPWAYLRDLFCLLPEWPRHSVLDLCPARWTKTLEDKHTQQLLAADVFRQITLGAFDAQLDKG